MKGHWCGVDPEDPVPVIYHGAHSTDAKTLISEGQTRFCLSYYDISQTPSYKHQGLEAPCRSFLDSGAFTFLVMGQKNKMSRAKLDEQSTAYCDHYSKWVAQRPKLFDFYVTFDYVVNAPTVWKVTEALQKLGIAPTPVYHGDASIDWLKRYIDAGYKLVGLSKRNFLRDRTRLFQYYDQCFSLGEKHGVRFHGFASGLGEEVWSFPFWSVDSTSVVKGSGFGDVYIMHEKHNTLLRVPVSERNNAVKGMLVEQIKELGFDMQTLRDNRTERVRFNARMIGRMQQLRRSKVWKRKTLF